MQTIKKYWPFILIAIAAAAIPVSALFIEPATEADASSAGEQHEQGFLKRADNLGYVWALQQAGGPSCFSFRKPGSPITVKTDVRRINNDVVSIGLVLEGRAGETYRPTIRKNADALSAPWLRIMDKEGKVIGEGEFEYG